MMHDSLHVPTVANITRFWGNIPIILGFRYGGVGESGAGGDPTGWELEKAPGSLTFISDYQNNFLVFKLRSYPLGF